MPLQLPNLDDRTYADLMEEARRLIPTYSPEWTNHNPSDPGITLIEMFAYLSEIMLYRLNRVTEANQLKFLKLLDPQLRPSGNLQTDTRVTVQRVRERFRAVTAADYERLALDDFNSFLLAMRQAQDASDLATLTKEWWPVTRLDPTDPAHLPRALRVIKRARCVPARNLERYPEQERTQPAPGHVSLAIVFEPEDEGKPEEEKENPLEPSRPLCQALWGFLDARRLITTRHHVVGPSYAPVGIDLVIARTDGAVKSEFHDRISRKLEDFLDPLEGGPSQQGWPFGRDVYVSELCEQLESIPGMDYVMDVMLVSECPGGEERCVQASRLWHAEGDLIGLGLSRHHLPKIDTTRLRIESALSSSFVPVRVTVTVMNAAAQDDSATIKQQVKSVVRSFFHPLESGPKVQAAEDSELLLRDLRAKLMPLVCEVAFEVDASRLLRDDMGRVIGFRVQAGEVVNWSTEVTLAHI